ncbi:RidA family protein [Actinoplanes hulinensis]|uniref:RidA family protein n=1 Tax=Actinoplanes hulinensis TaxID=1144547 RepID=A0ABS7B0C7_9ACTN|nr:RidA family protein [Actinoplanes hulinensis]MBW6434362.1 RidA family protein [Actinoplanes hulinensis]
MTVYLPAVPGYHQLDVPIGDVVHVTEYVTAAALADPAALDAARKAVFGEHRAPVSRVPVESIVGSGAPYAVAVVTHPGGGTLFTDGDDVIRVAAGVTYLPSVHTTEGDFRDQYRWCLERIATLLAVAGSDTGALVRTVDYTATATRAEYPRCGRPRREILGAGPVHPGAAGILVDVPVEPGAQVSLDALAASPPLEALNPGWARYDTLTYKPAVRAANSVYLAGFGALDPVSQQAIHAGDLVAQAEYVYRGIETVLAEAGATGENVVHLVEYLTPGAVADYPSTAALRERHFPNAVVTAVVCSALLRPEFLLETVPTAVLP